MVRNQPSVLIDATNLHVGGGVQVASSILYELALIAESGSRDFPWLNDLRIEASTSVVQNTRRSEWLCARVVEDNWRPDLKTALARSGPERYTVRLLVFGSALMKRRADVEIAGFADVTSIYPDEMPYAARRATLPKRAARVLRRCASLWSIRQVDHVVVETEAVAARLAERGVASDRISVVPNTYHPVFDQARDPDRQTEWKARIARETGHAEHLFLYVARAYRHKNHGYLAAVGEELSRRGRCSFKFLVTLTEAEWAAQPAEFRRHLTNLGPLDVEDLPYVYDVADAVVFPSLMECFSATPVEALKSGTPLFGSDRDFVRAHGQGWMTYFDPLVPTTCADQLDRFMARPGPYLQKVAPGRDAARNLPSSTDRAMSYVRLIDRYVHEKYI